MIKFNHNRILKYTCMNMNKWAPFRDTYIKWHNMILSQELDLSDLGSTNVFDYTDEILHIKDRVNVSSQNFTVNDCCSYKYQLLDQYCISRPYVRNYITVITMIDKHDLLSHSNSSIKPVLYRLISVILLVHIVLGT